MVRPRVVETVSGITGQSLTRSYDQMMCRMRDKGWLETKLLAKAGINSGFALEIGPGPGYLGLEWLKGAAGASLKGLEISQEMVALAERNAGEYGLEDRVEYIRGDARHMPFEDEYFDAVFSNGSLHEWAEPEAILNETVRVLKPGGRFCLSDLRRDVSFMVKSFMWLVTRPKEMQAGLISSIKAAYTTGEVKSLLERTELRGWRVEKNPMGLVIRGAKAGPVRV